MIVILMFLLAGAFLFPPSGWETLCYDVRPFISKNLTLRNLARTETVSRECQEGFLSRAAEQRANLIAAAEKVYGKGFISRFVTAVQRTMCGLSPASGWLVEM